MSALKQAECSDYRQKLKAIEKGESVQLISK